MRKLRLTLPAAVAVMSIVLLQSLEASDDALSTADNGFIDRREAIAATTINSNNALVVDADSYSRGAPLGDTRNSPNALTPIDSSATGGLDHFAAGTGLRNSGDGTIRLRGVDPDARLANGTLYWGIIMRSPAPTSATATFQGYRLKGSLVGTEGQCWGSGKIYALYRADVTHLIPPVINGDYKIDDVDTFLDNHADPWDFDHFDNSAPQAQGATLLVQYIDPDFPRASTVYINEGPFLMSGGALTINHTLSPPTPGPNTKHTRFGGDGQVTIFGPFGGVSPLGPGATGIKTWFGSAFTGLTQIKGPGSNYDTDSDWNGDDGGSLNQLWDTHTMANRINDTLLPAGSGLYTIRYTPGVTVGLQDCVNPSVHVLTSY